MPATDPPNPLPFAEGVDYVIERGLLVWTADYLRRRGHCCDNGCRNCPYRAAPNPSGGGGAGGVPDGADS